MNRILPLLVLVAAVVIVGIGCFRVEPRVVRAPEQPSTGQLAENVAPIAVIALNGGAGTVTRADQTESLLDGLEIMPGDTIAATSGTVKIVYTDAGASELEQGTTVTVLPDGQGQGTVFAQIALISGSIWTRFERLLGSDERFSVTGNDVVATVRGTAFGMELVDGDADVQVAEDDVDVRPFRSGTDLAETVTTVLVARGDGLRVTAEKLLKLDVLAAKKLIRALGAAERKRAGFTFMSSKLSKDLLNKKASVKWDLKPSIPERFRNRIDPTLLERILQLNALQANPTFVAPFRPIMPSDVAPMQTPSETVTTTSMYDGLNLLGETVK